MNRLRLSQVAAFLGGSRVGTDLSFCTVSTDTRTLRSGDLFIALEGSRFDGHRFIPQAVEQGAAAVMSSRECDPSIPQVRVRDTRLGLGRLAALWRDSFPVPLVAITGSNGKTTVKEMLAAILRQSGPVLATEGNLNNDIGLPLTLLRLQQERCAVVEMGANHPGEIGYLSHIARPDVAIITNAGTAHLEGFGDLEGVARAKGEILDGLAPRGTAVLNADDDYFPLWRRLLGERPMISFGESPQARVWAGLSGARTCWGEQGFGSRMEVRVDERVFEIELALAGRHNLMNALAAIAAARAMECPLEWIQRGLASVRPVQGRLCGLLSPLGVRLIDDTYNANPDSVSAAIQVLGQAPGNHWLVLGDLAELGGASESLHAEIGRHARRAGLDHLYTLGGLSRFAADAFGEGAAAFDGVEALVNAIKSRAAAGDTLLVKGSRSAAMERVVAALMDPGRA